MARGVTAFKFAWFADRESPESIVESESPELVLVLILGGRGAPVAPLALPNRAPSGSEPPAPVPREGTPPPPAGARGETDAKAA